MRIISLCPSLTELVCDLGQARELIACTKYCIHPERRTRRLLKVGGTKDPKLDEIVALSPDVVLMNDEENRREDYEALTEKGVDCYSTMPRTIKETASMVRSIAAVLGGSPKGEVIAKDIEERALRVATSAAERDPVKFAYIIWSKPWMSVNSDTFSHALLANAGGVNVFGDRDERYPEIELGELKEAAPDIVLLCTEPFPFKSHDAVDLSVEIDIPLDRIFIADGEYLSWHGSRTPDGIDYAESLIRGN